MKFSLGNEGEGMSGQHGMLQKLNYLFGKFTDWLLIGIGIVLIVKSAIAIDVLPARYGVMGIGVVLIVSGLFYRHRRKQRHR